MQIYDEDNLPDLAEGDQVLLSAPVNEDEEIIFDNHAGWVESEMREYDGAEVTVRYVSDDSISIVVETPDGNRWWWDRMFASPTKQSQISIPIEAFESVLN